MPSDPLDAAVERMLDGDEDAFREVYRTVQPPLLRYLTVLVGADAEDVASDTWAQAFWDLSRFEGDADGFRGWVTTIGRNRALDHVRRSKRQPLVVDDLEVLLDRADDTRVDEAALGRVAAGPEVAGWWQERLGRALAVLGEEAS